MDTNPVEQTLSKRGMKIDDSRLQFGSSSTASNSDANDKAVGSLRDVFYPMLSRLSPEVEPAIFLFWPGHSK